MVYNLRSIGLSLMQNSDINKDDIIIFSSESSNAEVRTSSLNNPSSIKCHHSTPPQPKLKTQQARKSDSSAVKSKTGNYSSSTSRPKRGYRSSISSVTTKMQNQSGDENNNDKLFLDASNNSCSKMTSSDTKASGNGCQESNHLTFRKSASVTCLESSSSDKGNDSASASGVNKQLVCTVINCSAHFSSKASLQHHYTHFKHSPCNPLLLNKNSSLAKTPLCYICPKCDREFQTSEECKVHMVAENHVPFYPPLTVTAYMCAQCLHMFNSFEECWKHLEYMSHHAVTYAFTDDQSLCGNGQGGPVAVVSELVEDFILRCGKVPYALQCLECGLQIESSARLEEHKLETNNQHTVASFIETSLVDVFAGYLATYVCNTCHRLFSGELKELAKHQCAKKILGTIVDNDTCSFSEFVKRCALTLIKSVDVDEGCLPGPSQCNPQTKSVHWMDTTDETSSDITDIEIDIRCSNHAHDALKTDFEKSKRGADIFYKRNTAMYKGERDKHSTEDRTKDKTNGDTSVGSLRGKKSVGNSNKIEQSECLKVVILDDSDTSDDTESIVNGGSKRKRKQKSSDRNKQLACESRPSSKGSDNKSNNQQVEFKAQGTSVSQDVSHCSGSLRFSPENYVSSSSQNSKVTAAQRTSREETSQQSGVVNIPGNQSSPLISNLIGEEMKCDMGKFSDVIEVDSDNDDGQETEFKKTENAFIHSMSKSGTTNASISHQPVPSTVNPARRAASPPQHSSYSIGNPFAAFNFIPHSPQLPPNVLTQGYIHQPTFSSATAIHHLIGARIAYSALPTMGGQPSRYSLRNSTVYGRQPSPTSAQQFHSASKCQNIRSSNSPENTQPVCHPQNTQPPSRPQTVTSVSHLQTTSSADLTSTDNMKRMKNIIFLDLDNWPAFFHKLPRPLPDQTFVWGFFGGKNCWSEPNRLAVFRAMKANGLFYLNERCGATKDAADFAIVLTVGKMDERLPSNIAFTILSGDKGFIEVERQMKDSTRKVLVVNPHTAAQFSNDMIYALVTSITDS